MRRVLLAASAALLSLGLAGSPAAASVAEADIAVEYIGNEVTVRPVNPDSPITRRDTGIGWVTFTLKWHNYGPNNTDPYTLVVQDITAPPGTVFRQLDEEYFAAHPVLCKVVVPHTHVRCGLDGSIWLDTYNGGNGARTFEMTFILKKKCVTPGRFSASYAGDPKTSNNSVRLPLKVPGVTAADCAPKPAAKPSPAAAKAKPSLAAASATPSQSAAASASPSPAEPTPTEPAPAESAAAILEPASDSSGIGSSGIVLAAVGAALAGVALLVGLRLYGRRRTADD